MTTKVESDYPPSPPNDESDGEEQDFDEEPVDKKPVNNNVSDILKRLQSSGSILKTTVKKELKCFTCDLDFTDETLLEHHLLKHISLPSIILEKLVSDDEDLPPSGDDWTDEEDDPPIPEQKTPQKLDISQIMQKTGLSIKKSPGSSDSALSKLSGLGFTIKKNSTPIKQETPDNTPEKPNDILKKLGQLGGLKLKLKSDGANSNSFKVIDGLKNFKTSDDEGDDDDELSKDDLPPDSDEEQEQEKDDSGGENNEKGVDSDEDTSNAKISNALKNLQGKKIAALPSPVKLKVAGKPAQMAAAKPAQMTAAKPAQTPAAKPTQMPAKQVRPNVKMTPKRDPSQLARQSPQLNAPNSNDSSASATPERRVSHESNTEKVTVKQETGEQESSNTSSNLPLFSGQVKTERASPPIETVSTPIIATVKSEPVTTIITTTTQPIFNTSTAATTPLLPVTKTEEPAIIEINGDSNDEDDDCCVVSATPAPDVKPIVPKTESTPITVLPPAYPTPPSSYGSTPLLSSRLSAPSTEKQHTFNWNAPDSKPPIDMLERSADDIFESLLSAKKESSLSDASEYISLDTLGPQHSCDVCNTRFTSIVMLDEHRRMTGHSQSLVTPLASSASLMPYNPQSNMLSSLLPVKQLAEQVGKLSGMGSGPGFTHQQNVMINIQAYPGAGGMPQQMPYNPYGNNTGQMHSGFPQDPNNMYNHNQNQNNMQYGQNYNMGGSQGYNQFQQPMSKSGYSGMMPPTSTYPGSPLQGMQQAAYGQSPNMMNTHLNQMGQMGPPGSSPSNLYIPSSSPSSMMKPPQSTTSNIKIQNVQTFPPGQMMGPPGMSSSGQTINSQQLPNQHSLPQMPAPGPIRMAVGANVSGPRQRMPIRGVRPTIRPGLQVAGQLRPKPPRMPMKRPGAMAGGPNQKRRPDMLLPGKHDNEDCQVMSMQKQRDGLPMIQSVKGAQDKLNLGSQISITKKTVNNEANAMANVLASRGISIKQKQKSRSPSPERPVPHIPNLPAGMSIKHTSKKSKFSIPEAKVGSGMLACKICKKMFNSNSLAVHMASAHPQSKVNMFKCEDCPASYPTSMQLQHHKRVFHNVQGPNRELGLPVVDFSQEDNLKRLSSLGIYSYIPLATREQPGGSFGIPVISVHNMQNGMTSSLRALGADGLLSLGPMKPIPNS